MVKDSSVNDLDLFTQASVYYVSNMDTKKSRFKEEQIC